MQYIRIPGHHIDFEGRDIPSTVFKFRDWSNNHHREILKGRLYFSSPLNFNDPFDCNIPVSYELLQNNPELQLQYFTRFIEEQTERMNPQPTAEAKEAEIKRLIKEAKYNDPEWLRSADERAKKLYSILGVFCLSMGKSDMLQWAHYTNSHRGFCIGFHSKLLFQELLDSYGVAGGYVKYYDKFPIISPNASWEDKMLVPVLSKACAWCYEKEYRLRKLGSADQVLQVSPQTIKEIAFGINMTEMDKSLMMAYIEKELPHIRIYQAQPAHRAFRITFKRLK